MKRSFLKQLLLPNISWQNLGALQCLKLGLIGLVLCLIFPQALVAQPVEGGERYGFVTAIQLQRYQALVFELRCPHCQNQNLADSDSQIAKDLRAEVVRLIKEGEKDDEIKDFMVARYGDFVLYRPPMQRNTLILWWAPFILLLIGALVFILIVYRRGKQLTSRDDDDQTTDPAAR